MNTKELEVSHCFKKEPHKPHKWHEQFHCYGQGLDDNGYVRELGDESPAEADTLEENILDTRQAYGDRQQNMREQATLWNAYLSGRTIEAHDVPVMFILTKLHRLGKMPDYKDNYTDVRGYLDIAQEIVGSEMIDAATTKEYSAIKADRQKGVAPEYDTINDGLVEAYRDRTGPHYVARPRHPYENVERDAEADAMNAWTCGKCERAKLIGHDDNQIPTHHMSCVHRNA